MNRTNHLLLPLALAIFGVSITAGYPDWGILTGLVILLLAAGLLVGELSLLSEKKVDFVEKRGPQKISNGLVTLSSAAILAIYLAGYHRTGPAAARYAQQDARIRAAELNLPAPQPAPPGASVAPSGKAQAAPLAAAPAAAQPRKSARSASSNGPANSPA